MDQVNDVPIIIFLAFTNDCTDALWRKETF